MKRRLVAAGLVLLFPLGMAACGSQSKADACKEINNARDKALEQVDALSSFSGSEDFKNKLDVFLAIHKEAAKKVTNKKVKPVFQSFIADMERIIELYDDGDTMFSSKEFDSAMTDMENHGKKLSDLCGFGWDIGS